MAHELRHEDGDLIALFYNPREMLRVTTDAAVFEYSADNCQLFSPGGEAFEAICLDGHSAENGGPGVAWLVERAGNTPWFAVATRFGVRQVGSFDELAAALEVVGEPCAFPLTEWPGVRVVTVA